MRDQETFEEDGITRLRIFNYCDSPEIGDALQCDGKFYTINTDLLTNEIANFISYQTIDGQNYYFAFSYFNETYIYDSKDDAIKLRDLTVSRDRGIAVFVIREGRKLKKGDVLMEVQSLKSPDYKRLYEEGKYDEIQNILRSRIDSLTSGSGLFGEKL